MRAGDSDASVLRHGMCLGRLQVVAADSLHLPRHGHHHLQAAGCFVRAKLRADADADVCLRMVTNINFGHYVLCATAGRLIPQTHQG